MKNTDLEYIISSKESENMKRFLCAGDKDENEYQKYMIFKPSGGTPLKTVHDGLRNTSEMTVEVHSLSSNPQMQVKALIPKEEGTYEHDAWCGGTLVSMEWAGCTIEKDTSSFSATNASIQKTSLRKLVSFSKTMLNHILHPLQKHCFKVEESRC